MLLWNNTVKQVKQWLVEYYSKTNKPHTARNMRSLHLTQPTIRPTTACIVYKKVFSMHTQHSF